MKRVSKNVFSTITDYSISATGYCFATYRSSVKRDGKLEIVGTEADLNSYSIYSLCTQLYAEKKLLAHLLFIKNSNYVHLISLVSCKKK
jgi:hypothetical protein